MFYFELMLVDADGQKYSDLIDLYQGKKMHDKALTMLEEWVSLRACASKLMADWQKKRTIL
jgi:hypothetical protein